MDTPRGREIDECHSDVKVKGEVTAVPFIRSLSSEENDVKQVVSKL